MFVYLFGESILRRDPGRSDEGGKTASKAFKNGTKDPRNATLDEPVSRLIRVIVCDLAQKII